MLHTRKWLAVMATAALVFAACSSESRAPRASGGAGAAGPDNGSSSGSGFDPGSGGGCADSLCGSEVHDVEYDAPNVYFVLDRSGSMSAPATSSQTRYEQVRDAAVNVVRSLGALINVGAALFPAGNLNADPCSSGAEVFPVRAGVPQPAQGDSEVVQGLRQVLNITPIGGTPIAATLEDIRPALTELSGRTVVMLLTDGGPNCNENASCTINECMLNIEGSCTAANENCCVPGHPEGGPRLCLDSDPTLSAIQSLREADIDVYIIGIPGSDPYSDLLDEMADVAGTAQSTGPTKYHRVEDLGKLGDVLGAIAAEAINCDFLLSDPPSDKDFTNVYLDCDPLDREPINGWDWVGDDTVELKGSSCELLKQGQVAQVQVVTGCPTEIPN